VAGHPVDLICEGKCIFFEPDAVARLGGDASRFSLGRGVPHAFDPSNAPSSEPNVPSVRAIPGRPERGYTRRALARRSRLLLALLCAVAGAALASPGAALAGTWCGNDVAQSNRVPEAVAGHQIHVIYAFPSDGADRFSSVASPIVTDLESIDAWWRSQDPSRTPRFDQFAFPGCPPGLTRLDLTKVRLPRPSAAYIDVDTILERLFVDLGTAPFGFTHGWAKYLVYYDGVVDEADTCGIADTPPTLGFGRTIAAILLRSCIEVSDLGQGGYVAWTTAHEVVHSLSAVHRAAPSTCPQEGHTCDNDQDLMAEFVSAPVSSALLDHNRDDWYGHAGSWPDVQDSPWLYRLGVARPQLTVALAGAAGGAKVQSEVPGIACPPQCSIDWDPGVEVRLAAVPPANRRFVRWQGACGNREEVCAVTLDASKDVTAVFGPRTYRLSLAVSGSGTIRTSLGRSCARSCATAVGAEETVRLRAQPRTGHRFVRWSGACRGRRTTCTVALTAPRSVRAHFAPRR
jgi:Divergent InlB B-repeat domain